MAQSFTEAGVATGRPSYLDWGSVLAGAVGAAALSFLLLTFGGAVGLSITSPWPHLGVSATTVAIVVGFWMVVVQVSSFAAGGYVAGRLRSSWADPNLVEHHFRDGAHGFAVWAVGVLFGAILLGMTGAGAVSTLTKSASLVAAGATSSAAAPGAQGLTTTPIDYAIDLLMRPGPRANAAAAPQPPQGNLRMEVGRIFSSAISNQALTQRDRDYLTQIVAARTGLPEAEAQRRVDAAVTEARDLELKARQSIDKARKAAIVAGFVAAATLLISLGAACAGSSLGGRHRDQSIAPTFLGHRFW